MSRWLPRWLESRRAILGGDATTTEMIDRLSRASSDSNGVRDIERAALALQIGAAQRVDSASRKKLARAVRRVERAEHRYRNANARVDQFKSGALVQAMRAHEIQEAKRAHDRATEEIDRTAPRVRPLTVVVGELVLLLAEFSFYYQVFSRSVQADAAVLDRIQTAVMALLVPVVGIMSARFFAGTTHYLRALRPGESQRAAWLFVGTSTVLLGVACYATVRLVAWRYHAEDSTSFGAADHPPGTIMAVVFAVFLLVDALTRAFMFDPSEVTTIGRRWSGRYTRRIDRWLLKRESAALASWQSKWFDAKSLVEKIKNDADQELLSATIAVLLARGESGHPGSKLRGVDETLFFNGDDIDVDVSPNFQSARSSGAPDPQIDEPDVHLFLPHRVARLTLARLEVIRPPEDPVQERRDHRDDLERASLDGGSPGDAHSFGRVPAPHGPSRLDQV